jgi:tight adherence protein B
MTMALALVAVLVVFALGGAAFAFAGDAGASTQKRLAAMARPQSGARAARLSAESSAQRKKNVTALLKDIEAKQAENKKKLTTRRRLDQAGLSQTTVRTYWIVSGLVALGAVAPCFLSGQAWYAMLGAGFAAGFGLPRWVLGFLKARREKKFTDDFANAIDIIVRSVKSGLPANDALRLVASEFRDPLGGEFKLLVESMKVGVTLEQALKRMYDNMPTTEVGFFSTVMTIQQKSGGNLSEALGNLAGVLRDRKRLQGKIKAMSSEAKASALIIGSLPPGVMAIVYFTTPNYMMPLFTERFGNLLLAGCLVWMGLGIFVMRQMINFKH